MSRSAIIFFALHIALLLLSSCSLQGSSFPEVREEELLISLQRTACFGSCPDYKVTIDGEGNVVFSTRPPLEDEVAAVHREFSRTTGVRVIGTHKTVIDKAVVTDLLKLFEAADFFSLKDEYRAQITDNPTYVLTIDTGNGIKTVIDYAGERAGMPNSVTNLENAVDNAAGTDKWIKGLPSVIPLLEAREVPFDGIVGLELMDAASQRGDLVTMEKLRALGAPLFALQGPNPLDTAIFNNQIDAVGWLIRNGALKPADAFVNALKRSVSSDNHEAFQLLLKIEEPRKLTSDLATFLLTNAAANADHGMVKLLLARGANPNGPGEVPGLPDPPLFEASNGIMSNDEKHSIQDRRKVVRTLLDAGADITYCRYGYCQSVLWQVSDREIARMLIDAGADPDFRDDEGEHIFFSISDEGVALLLIELGADINAVRPADGKTLRGWAKYEKWPRVIEILDRSGL